MLLDQFHEVVGEERMNVPEARGMTFYQIVTLASIVEHEAVARRGTAADRRRLPEPARRAARRRRRS